MEIKSRPGRLSRWAAPAWISRSHRRTAVAQASGAGKPVSVQVQGSQACRRDESVLALHLPGLLRFAGHGFSFVVVVLRALVSPDRIDEVNIFVGIPVVVICHGGSVGCDTRSIAVVPCTFRQRLVR